MDVWRPRKGVTITKMKKGLYLFKFYHQPDMDRVVHGGPWSFDNHLPMLGRVQNGVAMASIPLFQWPFGFKLIICP